MKRLLIKQDIIYGLLSYCNDLYPREGILLLRGKNTKDEITINSLVIPPLPIHSETYSSFPVHMLPVDLSILGTAHSHPNGSLLPSLDDLNNYFGIIMMIAGYPYKSQQDLVAFDREGNRLVYYVV